jgi:two-component system, OmpR family, response regulator
MPTILLVDDNHELLTLLARLVEAEGWTAVPVNRGKAALDLIAAAPPSAAVVDVLLPDMMGYDVAQALRNAQVPFVFMTGVFKGGRAAADARTQHGASAYFEKPFEAKKLVEALRDLVPAGRAPAPRAPAPPAPARPAAEPESDVIELDASDFDVEVAVEADEPVEAMDLTARVSITEDGKVSAVLNGAPVHAAAVATPARLARPPPPPAAAPRPAATRVDPSAAARSAGKLRDNLPDLFTAFYQAQQTGELTLQRGKVKKTIYFEKGRPCFAISNLVTDRFGPFLVRVGKINLSQLELCEAAADKTGRRTGDVLCEMGLLKETEKLYYIAQQVKAIVYSLFAWDDGEYRMHFTDRAAAETIKIELSPAHLITRGVKKLYKPERLYRLLPAETRLTPSRQPAFGLDEVELEKWEAELVPRIDGTRTVKELVELARRPDHVVYASLVGLLSLKILERT